MGTLQDLARNHLGAWIPFVLWGQEGVKNQELGNRLKTQSQERVGFVSLIFQRGTDCPRCPQEINVLTV